MLNSAYCRQRKLYVPEVRNAFKALTLLTCEWISRARPEGVTINTYSIATMALHFTTSA